MRININEKKKFTFKLLSLILILIVTVGMLCTDVLAATATASERGNTTSNLFNGGCMAYDTEWFYYVSEGKQKSIPNDLAVEYKGDPPGIFAKRLDNTGEPRRTQKGN